MRIEEAETGQQPEPPTARVAQIRRRRARAAVVMMVASLSIGFLLGRGSTWVVPLDPRALSVANQQPGVGANISAPKDNAMALLEKADLKASEATFERSRALTPNIGAAESRSTAMPKLPESTRSDVAVLNLGTADAGQDAEDTGQSPSETVDSVGGAEYWRKHAKEARRRAADMTYRAAKREMLNIALAYRRLAQQANDEMVDKKLRRRRGG